MRPTETVDLKLRSILESDRGWAAYALADLFPPWDAYSTWITGGRSAVLIFEGLRPPILFAHGEPAELDRLFARLAPGEYWFTLRPTDFSRLAPRFERLERTRMWRMRLQTDRARHPEPNEFARVEPRPPAPSDLGRDQNPGSAATNPGRVERLGPSDLPQLQELYGSLSDGPDAFSAEQLRHGVFYGVRGGDRLLSAAGTHVVCQELEIAALGNLATRPEQRSRGFGTQVSRAVIAELLDHGFGTIVLNVKMRNLPAIGLYRKLGFMPYCGFYEGRGSIK